MPEKIILSVEDERVTAMIIKHALTQNFKGITILQASGSAEALKLIMERRTSISIVISDGYLGYNSNEGPELLRSAQDMGIAHLILYSGGDYDGTQVPKGTRVIRKPNLETLIESIKETFSLDTIE